MTALPAALSPCRRHPCSVEHAELVRMFRSTVELWAAEAERVTGGYERELALYRQSHPMPSFKAFLIASRRGVLSADGRAA